MKKIIWVSSYPKSGNTWIRYLISNYFFNNDNNFNPYIIKNIEKFHLASEIINKKQIKENFEINPYNVSKYWIESQKKLEILNGNVVFLKTHNALININNNEFTNSDLSLAIIYVIRDPRDVAVSYAKYRDVDFDKTIEHMIKDEPIAFVRDPNNPSDIEITGSWAFHYNSWKNGVPSIPRIIVKYEDLLINTNKIFSEIINFLSKILKFDIDKEKVGKSVNLSNFESLKNFEDQESFFENYGGNNFYRTGKKDNWKDELNKKQIKKIEDSFSKEMKLLNYI